MCGTEGLRALLIAERERSLRQWRIPGRADEYEHALKSGAAVMVSSAQMLRALSLARLPFRQFAFGGADWGKMFVLDERDQLSECVG